MKVLKKILIVLVILVVTLLAASYFWLRSTMPDYEGTLELSGLTNTVEIIYDDFGVPHIYATNSHDAYMALGYVQAQERLFQMEMIRRVTSGRLSELLGEDFIKTDKTMLTLSIREMARKSASRFFKNIDEPYKKETLAYLKGINSFIEKGNLPIEFTLLNFKPEPFEPIDVYTAVGYMSLSFTSALSQEPIVNTILESYGEEYLIDFALDSVNNAKHYGTISNDNSQDNLSQIIDHVFTNLPVPVWNGSNNWVLSGDRSKSGKVLLANDTHIKYSQPAVWYEAYIEYPGFNMAGYYMSGVPYAIIGHNDFFAWGTTIFPFDNMDLYSEVQNPDNPNQVMVNDHWEDYIIKKHRIPVKNSDDILFNVKYTRHGPVLNGIYNNIATDNDQPVSLWWALNEMESSVLEALYRINNSKNIDEFEAAMPYIDIIGMNMVYGDIENNIALWSAGKIPMRPEHVNSKLFLDGASGEDEILGYYPFDENPKIINPEDGFITTSNDEPQRVNGILYPGYYSPGYRAARIKRLINSRDSWSLNELAQVQLDNTSERDTMLTRLILKEANLQKITSLGPEYSLALTQLKNWDGNTDISSIGATIFNNVVYYIMYNTFSDELNASDFNSLVGSFLLRSRLLQILSNENSPWIDNINTTDKKEVRSEIFTISLEEAIGSLKEQLGDDISTWRWGRVHTLTHIHPIGRQEPFDMVFNVGPFAKSGGNDVIDKEGFRYNRSGDFQVLNGPAMRMLIDFADTKHAMSIIPTGQSGNVMSPYYDDQAIMFNNGEYRTMVTDKEELSSDKVLVLKP